MVQIFCACTFLVLSKANLNVLYIINMMFRDRDVPEAEYLIWKSTDNGFKTNNKFGKKKKHSADPFTPHVSR